MKDRRPWFHLTDEEVERLNPPWDCVIVIDDEGVIDEPGLVYTQLHDDPRWINVGYVPMPRSRWGWFLHHVACGLMMRYPFWKVVGYALAHCRLTEEQEWQR